MKKRKNLMTLVLAMLFTCFNSFGQNGAFYRLNPPSEYCSDRLIEYKIDNVWDFFDGYTPQSGNNHPKYFKVTVSGPINFLDSFDEYLLVNDFIENNNEVTFQFGLKTTNVWSAPTWATIKIDGFYSTDGGVSFIEIPMDYSDDVPVKNTFPDIYGPDILSTSATVQYSIPSNGANNITNASVNLIWSVPNGWTILSDQGDQIEVQPTSQAGNIQLTTSPEVDACNYPAVKPISIDNCYTQGNTDFEFCHTSPEYNFIPTLEMNNKNSYPILTGDFNDDGELDIVCFQESTKVALSAQNLTMWSSGFVNTGAQYETPRMVGDFTGDGKDDIIIFGFNVTQVGVSLNNTFSTAPFNDYYALTYNDGYNDGNKVQRLIGNFNGDQYDDIVAFGYNEHDVALSDGSSFNANQWNGSYKFSANNGWDDYNKTPKLVGDFNGDGKDDIIGFAHDEVIVGISTGSEFVFSDWTTMLTYNNGGYRQSTNHRAIGDFNGDGKDDIIGFGANSVIVGISNGVDGFVMDTWLMEHFTSGWGWQVEGRELGSVYIEYNDNTSTYPTPNVSYSDRVCIGDVNGDGFDDLVGFKDTEVWISYSDGSKFLCPALSMGQFTGVDNRHTTRLVGNFDKSDVAEEVISLEPKTGGYFNPGKYHYLNCNSCDMPVAGAKLVKSNGSFVENGIHSIVVNDYCDNVTIDVSSSSCYENYFFQVHEYDNTTTGNITNTVYNSGWILGDAPSEINLSTYYNFQPNTLYMVQFGVGFNEDSEYLFVRMDTQPPSALLTITGNESSQNVGKFGKYYIVEEFCNSQFLLSLNMQGSESSCYDKYRFEMIEVHSADLSTIGSAVHQLPNGGGWTNGNAMPANIPMPVANMVPGKLYRIQLFIENANGNDVATKYVRLKTCTYSGKQAQIEEVTSSIIYPNPSGDNLVNILLPDYGEKGAIVTLYSMTGQKLSTFNIRSNETSTIDIQDLAPGTYNVAIVSDEKVETLLFVKTSK